VNVTDGEENGISGRWLEAAAPAHKVLSEGHMCGEVKVEATAPAAAAKGPRKLGASVLVRSSLLDIITGVVKVFWGGLAEFSVRLCRLIL